jgi:hypothetical protein
VCPCLGSVLEGAEKISWSNHGPGRNGCVRPNDIEANLIKSRVRLVLAHSFFGTLSLRLKLVPGILPTIATDGARIIYNPGGCGPSYGG